jgi:hypothetical protein
VGGREGEGRKCRPGGLGCVGAVREEVPEPSCKQGMHSHAFLEWLVCIDV